MAVLEDLPGIEVTVRIDGKALAEYDDNGDVPLKKRAKVTRHYIESKTDVEFTINVSVSRPYEMDCPSLDFLLLLDGKPIQWFLLPREKYLSHNGWEIKFQGCANPLTSLFGSSYVSRVLMPSSNASGVLGRSKRLLKPTKCR